VNSHIADWLNLGLRWFHLIAGISWIGNSFYFMWLDSHLEPPASEESSVEGSLWMVHSGGFYQVEKRKIKPGEMPEVLHWFKWEATFTWLSGIFLLSVVYYLSQGIYLIDPLVSSITVGQACLLSLASIVISWVAYDLLWQSPLGQKKPGLATSICLTGLFGLGYGLCHVFSGRAAFIHLGAIMGTLMVANVWVRILPAQQQMIDATQAGQIPDYTLGKKAKRRSTHNSYMTLPVLILMISNHFPNTYAHSYNWAILALLILVGGAIRHVMLIRAKKQFSVVGMGLAAAGLAILIYVTRPPTQESKPGIVQNATAPNTGEVKTVVGFKTVNSIVQKRCMSCHSKAPTDDIFKVPPNGVVLDSPQAIKILAERIKLRAILSKTMPLANKTGMTQEERDQLSVWIDRGAEID
jgi:uncharacterized membrane protein